MFDKFFGKKKEDDEDKKIIPSETKKQAQPQSKKEEFYQRVTSSYQTDSVDFPNQDTSKVSKKMVGQSDSAKSVNSQENLTEEKILKAQSKVDERSSLVVQSERKSQRIFNDDTGSFGRRKKVESIFSTTYKSKFITREIVTSIIILENGVFGESVVKISTLAEEIATKYYKCTSNNDYISNKILKYSFGEGIEDIKEYESKGKNLIEIFKYLSSLDLCALKASENLSLYVDKEKCIQLIILGKADLTLYSEEEISFMKQEITKMRDNDINTYFITTNKYTFADLASIGFRNVECINHEYSKV